MEIDYETIVGRREVSLDFMGVLDAGFGKERVLVTGAGGSIGSQIAERLASIPGVDLLATDRDENRLHSLSLRVQGTALFNSALFSVVDVRDKQGLLNVISGFQPTLVIHAAALKHLAILERQPREAYLTNVLGTQNVLDAAKHIGVERFLNISTDKAARPTSIRGKSKLIAEMMTAASREEGFGGYTSVRFGNVFNSKGSVIETFVNQIENNLPVTLTDKSVTRYFMKISEAANLSLLASIINAGDVHILEMGQPVLLMEIIQRLGDHLGKEYSLIEVGLREGEKLHEELTSKKEKLKKTSFEKVNYLNLDLNRAHVPHYDDVAYNDRDATQIIERSLKLING